jgi:glucuronoarabinoxylan endo-1,4-beta-xylanase
MRPRSTLVFTLPFFAIVSACGATDSTDGTMGNVGSGSTGASASSGASSPGTYSGEQSGAVTGSSSGSGAGGAPGGSGAGGAAGASGSTTGTSNATSGTGMTGTSGAASSASGMAGASGVSGGASGAAGTTGTAAGTTGTAAGTSGTTTGTSGSGGTKMAGTPAASDVIVNPRTTHQRISGFGASTAWMGTAMTPAEADLAFSTTSGAGLSLDRIRINYQGDGTSAPETATALLAQARGAAVWATPWTPPLTDKDNDNLAEGHLNNPSAYASFIAKYVTTMKAAGVNLYAVSSENEPDASGITYESCAYTAAQLATFIGSSMAPALSGSTVKLMGPETQNWCDFSSYASAIQSNSAAWSALSIIATHEYGCTPAKAFPAAASAGKEFWETEIYDPNTTSDNSITSGLWVAATMYDALANANMNAWHYWWFFGGSTGNAGLWNVNSPTKRLWVMGNFSRFVRPGFYRIDVSGPVPSGVSVIAFQNPADNTIAIVAVNTNTGSTSVPLFVSGMAWPAQVTPWVTSASADLVSQAAVTVSGARFSATLAAKSVTTFVGKP